MAKKPAAKAAPKTEPKPTPEPAKTGRPPTHGPEIWDEIIARHSEGETITSICRDEHMPTLGSVSRKAADDNVFGARLTRAKAMFADAIFDEALEIADGTGKDRGEKPKKPDGSIDLMAVKADVHRDRLRIDTRMRIAAKANPAKYADRVNVQHSGSVDLNGVDDQTLNQRLVRRLHDLGVIALLESWDLTDEQKTQFLELFRVHELPTAPQPMRALPGEVLEGGDES